MSLFSSALLLTRSALRGASGLARDLAPWLVQATTGWLLSRLRARNRPVDAKCSHCPFLQMLDRSPAPATAASRPQATSLNAQKVSVRSVLFLLSLSLISTLAAGCTTTASYVAADRQTYDAIAPEYAAYITSDPSLDDLRRARRRRTIETWRLRIKQAEASASH